MHKYLFTKHIHKAYQFCTIGHISLIVCHENMYVNMYLKIYIFLHIFVTMKTNLPAFGRSQLKYLLLQISHHQKKPSNRCVVKVNKNGTYDSNHTVRFTDIKWRWSDGNSGWLLRVHYFQKLFRMYFICRLEMNKILLVCD